MFVKFELDNGVAIVTLDRPEARNAIDRATALAVYEAMQRIDADREIRVGVIPGAGGNFCAGLDLKAFMRGEVVRLPEPGFAGVTQTSIHTPLNAAISGSSFLVVLAMARYCCLMI